MSKWLFGCVVAASFALVLGVCAVRAETAQPVEIIEITVSPNTLYLDSQGTWVSVHTDIPYGIVDTASLRLNDVEIAWTKSDAQGCLVAKFNLDDVKGIVAPPAAELTLSGTTSDGSAFMGVDTVKVIANTKN